MSPQNKNCVVVIELIVNFDEIAAQFIRLIPGLPNSKNHMIVDIILFSQHILVPNSKININL